MQFWGYRRSDGRVGIRNHVVVMPGAVCSSVAAKRIANQVENTVYLYNPNGCGQGTADSERTLEVLSGLLANPNVFGALVVGMGCETLQGERYLRAVAAKASGKPISYISIQQEGGLQRTVARGAAIVRDLMNRATELRREPCDISELMLGLECGGSDPTSGLSANVVLGEVSDRLVDLGGTVVFSETSEAIGAENVLRERGATKEIGDAIYCAIRNKDVEFRKRGEDIRDSNPSPGNLRSGISTLEEKSLGCIRKSGTHVITGYFRYGELVTGKGVTFMETASYDAISTVAEIAGGCQAVMFTTGLGTPMGCAIAPVIKITGNRDTYARLTDILDFDTSATLWGERTAQEVADKLIRCLVGVCNGRLCRAEQNGADVLVIDQHFMGS